MGEPHKPRTNAFGPPAASGNILSSAFAKINFIPLLSEKNEKDF
jgi:hypothetical protein